MKNYHVYILLCADNTYYTGITNNLERRIIEHEEGLVASCYTFSRRPIKVVWHQIYNDVNQAIRWEKRIKNWSKRKKEALMNERWNELKLFAECKNETSHKNHLK